MHETNVRMATARGSLREGGSPDIPRPSWFSLAPARWRDGVQGEVERVAPVFRPAEAVIGSWSGAKRKWPTIS